LLAITKRKKIEIKKTMACQEQLKPGKIMCNHSCHHIVTENLMLFGHGFLVCTSKQTLQNLTSLL